jgi:lipoprotein-anchoring transpeptidase ErfK/SrfK
VTTGAPGRDTPNGRFTAQRLARVYYSKKFDDAPMPNSVFFHGGYAIHGTYEEAKLGTPVSHGCVRLTRANTATLYVLVSAHGLPNTHIVITGDTPRRWRANGPSCKSRIVTPSRAAKGVTIRPMTRDTIRA